jgi:outer membrane lipoprotein-sorting protein
MKKRLFTILTLTFFTLGILPAQDLHEIMDAHFEAIGQKNLINVNTLVMTGKILQMGMEMPFKTITKRPDKAYIEAEIQDSKMKQGWDGKNGWMVAPWTGSAEPIDLTGPDLRGLQDAADMDGPLWDYQAKGHKLELVGKEDMEGTQVYVLKLSRKDGNIDYMYMDAENYMVLKLVSKTIVNGSETEIEARMSNFQDVDGYTMPFTIEQTFDGQPGMSFNIEKVTRDDEIDDSIFSKPVVPAKTETE